MAVSTLLRCRHEKQRDEPGTRSGTEATRIQTFFLSSVWCLSSRRRFRRLSSRRVRGDSRSKIAVNWICGTSIGGINGALIAGNRTERRVERLREFWEVITKPPIGIPGAPYFAAVSEGHWTNRLSALTSMLYGVPEFFAPRPFPPLMSVTESPNFVSYYDTNSSAGDAYAPGRLW